jgi:hypothetical protein
MLVYNWLPDADRQTDRQGRQTDRQTGQTDRQPPSLVVNSWRYPQYQSTNSKYFTFHKIHQTLQSCKPHILKQTHSTTISTTHEHKLPIHQINTLCMQMKHFTLSRQMPILLKLPNCLQTTTKPSHINRLPPFSVAQTISNLTVTQYR